MTTSNMKNPSASLPLLLGLAIGIAGFYWLTADPRKPEDVPSAVTTPETGLTKDLAKGPMAALLVHSERKAIASFSFANDKNETLDLSRWKGRVVLLNLWATWCAPCREEMPDLADLQKQLGGDDFEVVALSLDRKGLDASAAFLKEIGVSNLTLYIEPEAKSLAALQALGLPATILIDRNGMEAARLLGPADWASQEALTAVRALIADKP